MDKSRRPVERKSFSSFAMLNAAMSSNHAGVKRSANLANLNNNANVANNANEPALKFVKDDSGGKHVSKEV
ncbi:hypothetical protein ACI3PL_28170, partial [Lacticaseibacillus paracasei]